MLRVTVPTLIYCSGDGKELCILLSSDRLFCFLNNESVQGICAECLCLLLTELGHGVGVGGWGGAGARTAESSRKENAMKTDIAECEAERGVFRVTGREQVPLLAVVSEPRSVSQARRAPALHGKPHALSPLPPPTSFLIIAVMWSLLLVVTQRKSKQLFSVDGDRRSYLHLAGTE